MRDQAKALDRALADTFSGFATLRSTLAELNQLGACPSMNLIDSSCRRALVAAPMGSPLVLEHLAPHERHSVADLAEKWMTGVEHFASSRLGKV